MTDIKSYLQSKIARKIVLAIVLASTVITIFITALQLYLDYKNELSQIDVFFTQIEKSYFPVLANSLWDFDDQQVEKELQGIQALPGIEYVEIINDGHISYFHGNKEARHVIDKRFPLSMQVRNRTTSLGELHLVYSLDFVYDQLVRQSLSILIGNGLLTLLLAVFLLFLVHHLVTHPLFSIAARIKRIDLDRRSQPRDSMDNYGGLKTTDEFKEILYAIKYMQDGMKQAFQELENNQKRYLRLFEQSPVPLWEEDFTAVTKELSSLGPKSKNEWREYFHQHPSQVDNLARMIKVIDVNNAALRLHNAKDKEELTGNLDKIFNKKSLLVFKEELIALATGMSEFRSEGEVVSLDGNVKTISLNISFGTNDHNPNIALLATEDISQRVEKERENDMLISALKTVAESVMITDAGGDIIYVNPAFEQISGYLKEEVLGKNPRILASGAHDSSFYASMWEILSKGEVWRGQLCNKRRNGEFYYEDVSITPVFSSDGSTTNYVAVKRDITKEREARKQLLQTQKMESIGNLAGGIAHDFNNILSSILGFSELALEEIEKDSPLHDDINEVITAAIRAKDLVRQILLFARKSDEEIKPVQVAPVISEVVSFLESTTPATITIDKTIVNDANVLGNTTQLHQVMMNLGTNGVQAIGNEVGQITFTLDKASLKHHEIKQLPFGDYVRIRVSDTGKGIPQEDFDAIFEPYFSTKSPDEGTGLGLSVVQGIIDSYGGEIDVASQINTGTTFTIYLPGVHGNGDKIEQVTHKPALGNERILFVDDEKAIATLGERLLENLGYLVTTRANGSDALEVFRSDPSAFDLIISDMTMPKMTGDELARECIKIKPGIPIILCTGFSSKISQDDALSLGVRAFIFKPITKDELAATVRKVLDTGELTI